MTSICARSLPALFRISATARDQRPSSLMAAIVITDCGFASKGTDTLNFGAHVSVSVYSWCARHCAGIEYVGEVFSEFLGMTGSRYDWALEAAARERVRYGCCYSSTRGSGARGAVFHRYSITSWRSARCAILSRIYLCRRRSLKTSASKRSSSGGRKFSASRGKRMRRRLPVPLFRWRPAVPVAVARPHRLPQLCPRRPARCQSMRMASQPFNVCAHSDVFRRCPGHAMYVSTWPPKGAGNILYCCLCCQIAQIDSARISWQLRCCLFVRTVIRPSFLCTCLALA